VHLGSFATAEEAALCVARLRESNLRLVEQFEFRAALPSFQQLLPNYDFISREEPAASSLPVPPAASTRTKQVSAQQIKQVVRRKRPRSEDEDGHGSEVDDGEDDDGHGSEDSDRGGSEEDEQLQLVKALFLSATEAQAPPDERRERLERLERRGNHKLSAAATVPADRGIACEDCEEEGKEEGLALGVAVAPPSSRAAGSASSSNGNEDGLADEGGEEEEKETCFCAESFVGEPSNRPNRDAPESGWGRTLCCGNPVHFDCIGGWLNPRDKLVDSTSGPVQMNLRCPFCWKPLSRSTGRQLHAEGRPASS